MTGIVKCTESLRQKDSHVERMQKDGMPKQIARAATEVITKTDHHEKDGEMRYKRRSRNIIC